MHQSIQFNQPPTYQHNNNLSQHHQNQIPNHAAHCTAVSDAVSFQIWFDYVYGAVLIWGKNMLNRFIYVAGLWCEINRIGKYSSNKFGQIIGTATGSTNNKSMTTYLMIFISQSDWTCLIDWYFFDGFSIEGGFNSESSARELFTRRSKIIRQSDGIFKTWRTL